MADPITEQLRQCRDDPGRAAEVLDTYRERLRGVVTFRLDARVRARVDESDVVQETLIRALATLDRYLEDTSIPLFVWLRLIAAERVLQLHRFHLEAQKRDARVEVSMHRRAFPGSESGVLADHLLASGTAPSDRLARDELRAVLAGLFDRLSGRDREILELRHFERLTNQEAAHVLGVTENTAASRYFRALRRLRAAADQAGVSF